MNKVNTYLCVDLKTVLQEDRTAKVGKAYKGRMTRDEEEHFEFVEQQPGTPPQRWPKVFDGVYVSITLRDDGMLYPHFKQTGITHKYSLEAYAMRVANELLCGLYSAMKKVNRA